MTIGIALRGPRAGLAAYRALLAAELLGRGEIGGFCVFAWRDSDGRIQHATTQRGGTGGLGLQGDWATANHAALISSGADRPEPLTQFLPWDADAGFVTGHRLPHSPLPDGRPINLAALDLLRQGRLDGDTLSTLLATGPAMDAGLIALPMAGPCLSANAPRVARRADIGHFSFESGSATGAILHNAIFTAHHPGHALAAVLGAIAQEVMGLGVAPLGLLELPPQLTLRPADHEALELDAGGAVIALHSTDPAYHRPRPGRITAIYDGLPLLQAGRVIGHALTEVFAAVAPPILLPAPQPGARSFLFHRL